MDTKGKLVTCDIWMDRDLPEEHLEYLFKEALKESNMHIVNTIHHKFEPTGATYLYLLAESHFSIHTYPENRYLSLDCYTCGTEGDPDACINFVLKHLPVVHYNKNSADRGIKYVRPKWFFCSLFSRSSWVNCYRLLLHLFWGYGKKRK